MMEIHELPTPCYVVDEKKLEENLKILRDIEQETGCKNPAGAESFFYVL